MKIPNQSRINTQEGAGLLLFILVTAVILTFLITTFLTVASRITTGTQDYIRAQHSMYTDMAASKIALSSFLDNDPTNDWSNDASYTPGIYWVTLPDGTVVERTISELGSDISFDLTSISGGSARRIEALLTTANLANTEAEVVLVIDNSSSMDPNPGSNPPTAGSRMERVLVAADEFLEKFDDGSGTSNAKIGIITFATEVKVVSPLGNNIDQLQLDLATIYTPGAEEDGSTFMGGGLAFAYQMLTDDPTSKHVILLTDGKPSVEPSGPEVGSVWHDYNDPTRSWNNMNYGVSSQWGRCKPWERTFYWSSCNNRARQWPIDMGQILRNDPPDPVTGDNARPWKFQNVTSKDATIWGIAAEGANESYLHLVTNVPDQVISVSDANFEDEIAKAFGRIGAGIVGQRMILLEELTPE